MTRPLTPTSSHVASPIAYVPAEETRTQRSPQAPGRQSPVQTVPSALAALPTRRTDSVERGRLREQIPAQIPRPSTPSGSGTPPALSGEHSLSPSQVPRTSPSPDGATPQRTPSPEAESPARGRPRANLPAAPNLPRPVSSDSMRITRHGDASTTPPGTGPAASSSGVAHASGANNIGTVDFARAASPHAGPHEPSAAQINEVGTLRMMLDNTAKANGLGWVLNVLHASGREGTITFLATAVREVVGQLAAQKLEHASEQTKIGISAGIIGATGLLNVLTAVSQHRNGRANWMTRSAQVANVGLLGGAAGIAATTGGLGAAAPLLIKATTYTAARDTLNLFLRLNDNRDPEKQDPSKRAVATDMFLYGGNQIAVNELQGLGAAHSGTSAAGLSESRKSAFGHISAFSAGNAAGETLGALVYPALTGFYDNLGKGLGKALKGVQEVRLSTRAHVPFGKDAINQWAGSEVVGGVTMGDVKDKMTGAMLGRESLFVTLYTLIDALSQIGPAHDMSEKNSAHLTNALAGLAIGFMLSSFIGIASATPRRPVTATVTDLETGLSDDRSRVSLESMAPDQPGRPRHSVEQP